MSQLPTRHALLLLTVFSLWLSPQPGRSTVVIKTTFRTLKGAGYGGVAMVLSSGDKVFDGAEDGVRLTDFRTGAVRRVATILAPLRTMDVSPDEHTLVTGTASQFTGQVRLWDVHTGRLIRTLATTTFTRGGTRPTGIGPVWAVAFSPNGKMVAVGTMYDGDLDSVGQPAGGEGLLLSTRTGRAICRLKIPYAVTLLAFSPGGGHVAAYCGDGKIRVCSSATGRVKRSIKAPTSEVQAMRFASCGRLLGATITGAVVKIWNLKTGKLETVLKGARGPLAERSLAFTRDGRSVAVSGQNSSIYLWHLR